MKLSLNWIYNVYNMYFYLTNKYLYKTKLIKPASIELILFAL